MKKIILLAATFCAFFGTAAFAAQETITNDELNEAIERLSGITCGFRPTSCPDQVAVALKQALNK